MLVLHVSNRMERLTDQLFSVIRNDPPPPWSPVTILPQNPTIGRWLNYRLADWQGVAMNIATPLPGAWIRDFLETGFGCSGQGVHFERNALFLRLLRLLPSLRDDPAFSEFRHYLEEGDFSRRLVSLADELSELFDRAMLYRPECLTSWEDSPEELSWPAILWRNMAGGNRPSHFARLLQNFQSLPVLDSLWRESLPDRLFLFGLSGIAPATLDIFLRIGRETPCQVHFFFLNPTDRYWADMVSLRSWQNMEEDLKSYFDPGHPLLAFLGRTARDLHKKLEDAIRPEDPGADVRECFEEPGGTTILSRLQRSMFRMDAAGEFPERLADDGSLRIVSSPSVVREVETLRDFLLDRFLALPDLRLEDVVILAPETELYAGTIRAVFEASGESGSDGEPVLPVTVSDRPPFEATLAEALYGLLRLPVFPLTLSFVERLLTFPEVLDRFSLDRKTASELLEALVRAGFRWGVDKKDRSRDEPEDHTLDWAVSRILEGYCTGREERDSVLPVPPFVLSDDPQGEKAGLLFRLLERFRFWRDRLSGRHPLSVWAESVSALLSDFFVLDPDRDRELFSLGKSLQELCRDIHDIEDMDCTMVTEMLSRRIFRITWRDRFFSGGITFGRMVPLRSIPFRIVCLLGMGESAFPRNDVAQSFDFLREAPRPLDRSVREDDLHLFLETLLSARSSLWISYVGGEGEDGTTGLPSSPVRQLLETLREPFPPEKKGTGLFREVPSDPFDPSCFSREAGSWGSFSSSRAGIVQSRHSRKSSPSSFFVPKKGRLVLSKGPEDSGMGRRIALSRLQSFYRNPPFYQAKNVLNLAVAGERPLLSDEEPFLLDPSREVEDPAQIPWPPVGVLQREQQARKRHERLERLLGGFEGLQEDQPETRRFSLSIGNVLLFGTLSLHRETGLIVQDPFPWKLRPSDLLRAFLAHLAGSLAFSSYRGTILLDPAKDFPRAGLADRPVFWSSEPEEAKRLLRPYLVLYRRFRTRTFPFVPAVSLAYALEQRNQKRGIPDPEKAIAAAQTSWRQLDPWSLDHGQKSSPKNAFRKDARRREGFYPHLFFDPDGEWIKDPFFGLLAQRLWDPVLDRLSPDPEEGKE